MCLIYTLPEGEIFNGIIVRKAYQGHEFHFLNGQSIDYLLPAYRKLEKFFSDFTVVAFVEMDKHELKKTIIRLNQLYDLPGILVYQSLLSEMISIGKNLLAQKADCVSCADAVPEKTWLLAA